MSPSSVGIGILGVVGIVLAVCLVVVICIYAFVPLVKALVFLVGHVLRWIGATIRDLARLVGALLAVPVFSVLVVLNIIIGRWSASAHFGGAVKSEVGIAGACVYRVLIGHPLRLLGLAGVVEGLEQRLPEAVAHAPTADKPGRRTGQFEGYRIVGSLPTGGSGSKLYIAEPDEIKRAALERGGFAGVGQVVIKSFSIQDGSNLPSIVRESRALEAARRLGLVLDHELTATRFFYVMRYVPGNTLNVEIQRLHAQSDPSVRPAGLDDAHLRLALGYIADLVRTLEQYHQGGLWHKDVKPENIVVENLSGLPRAHLVDFGLVTPLGSAMTLTTHGTEYFRDPELVRLALRGVRVNEVDGGKFDVYAAGAVLYATIENSFPAHGVLSQVSRRCPEAVKWIIRRAMADYEKRYAGSSQLLADLECVRLAPDPFALRPIDLPSMRAAPIEMPTPAADPMHEAIHAATPADRSSESARGSARQPDPARRADVRVVNWWTGEHVVVPDAPKAAAPFGAPGDAFAFNAGEVARQARESVDEAWKGAKNAVQAAVAGARHGGRRGASRVQTPAGGTPKRSAADQIRSARARVEARRTSIRNRWSTRYAARAARGERYSNAPGLGTLLGGAVVGAMVLIGVQLVRSGSSPKVENVADLTEFARGVRDGAMDTLRLPPRADEAVEGASLAPGAVSEGEASVEVAGAGPGSGSRVLLISDLPAPLSRESKTLLRGVERSLRSVGFSVGGDVVVRQADLPTEEMVEFLAQARVRVSGVAVGDAAFRDRLTEWAQEKGFAAVAWLRPSLDGEGKPDLSKPTFAHVVSASGTGAGVRDAARDAVLDAIKTGR